MKISAQTLEILKNFTDINNNFRILKGSEMKTKSPRGSIVGFATVHEEFPVDFDIYDMSELLGTFKLFKDPSLHFSEDGYYVDIVEDKGSVGNNTVRYVAAGEDVLQFNKTTPKFTEEDIFLEIVLDSEEIKRIKSAGAALKVDDISFIGDGEKVIYKIWNKRIDGGSSFSRDLVLGTVDTKFELNFKYDYFKMLPGKYTAQFSISKEFLKFKHSEIALEYFIGMEADSEVYS